MDYRPILGPWRSPGRCCPDPCRTRFASRALRPASSTLPHSAVLRLLDRLRALVAAKARGVKLDNPKLAEARVAGQAICTANADQRAAAVLPVIEAVKASGAVTLHDIAAALNACGIRTARGGEWTAIAVSRVVGRV